MLSGMQSLIVREEGQDLVEYALVLALIALATVASMNTLAIAIETALINIGMALTSAG
jgi:pilus assembly protein Flp/PilA